MLTKSRSIDGRGKRKDDDNKMKRLMIALAVVVAGLCPATNAAEKPDGRVELSSVAKMESRTKDPKRDPGIFGDYWWANRFLSRHQEIEKLKGRTVDVVLLGDSIMHFWEWKHPQSWAKFTANRVALNLGYGGDRTQNVIWRVEHGELDGYEAKCVVLMIGTNNNSSDRSTYQYPCCACFPKNFTDMINYHG